MTDSLVVVGVSAEKLRDWLAKELKIKPELSADESMVGALGVYIDKNGEDWKFIQENYIAEWSLCYRLSADLQIKFRGDGDRFVKVCQIVSAVAI